MGGSSRGDHEMRLFLCLVVVLACVALSTAGKKAKTRVVNCKKLAKKFSKCLKKGFAPKKLENCKIEEGDLKKKAAKKCARIVREVVTSKPVLNQNQNQNQSQSLSQNLSQNQNQNRNQNQNQSQSQNQSQNLNQNRK